ncbi:MAG TPA: polysaccharide ABC transporter ATP-binding protein [Bacteroidia bacterium]|nr:polysaccharide ABC transporter ATP-binding protein [Bacteroidia bacterium]
MSQPIIKAEGIGKKYEIFHQGKASSDSLVGAISGGLKNMFRSGNNLSSHEDFWAVKDISFDINKGDRVGIVGRNGAGKSTLLKILSRIVKPTTGRIEFEGRMASLLEVGTGFHGDLTGRENIYLNGSILGMSNHEIKSRFDEIVAFSEVEQFLDTPVKRYSSGMYVRLAFAVAAHLEPEILIVDEVLAVGDAQFQSKCLGKMEDVSSKEGRTILFVSHNMQAVQKLCNTGIYLQKGRLIEKNSIDKIVNRYLQASDGGLSEYHLEKPADAKLAYAFKVIVEDLTGKPLHEIPVGSAWQLRVLFRVIKPVEHFIIGLGISSAFDMPVRTSWSIPQDIAVGEYEMIFDNSDLLLTTGNYKLVIGLSSYIRTFQYIKDVVSVNISDVGQASADKRIVNTDSGLILNPMKIQLNKIA